MSLSPLLPSSPAARPCAAFLWHIVLPIIRYCKLSVRWSNLPSFFGRLKVTQINHKDKEPKVRKQAQKFLDPVEIEL